MSRPRKRLRIALATVSMVLLLIVLIGGGVALIWIPVDAIVHFKSQNLAWFTPFGRPVTANEQRNHLIFDSLFFIVIGILLLVFAYACLRGFISYLRE